MPGLLIKNVPTELHHRLKQRAKENRRSMTQEALVLIESGLGLRRSWTPPPPVKGKKPLTDEWIDRAKREGYA